MLPTSSQRLRATLVLVLVLLLFAGLGRRLYQIQVVEAERWRRLAYEQQRPLREVAAYRGDIRTADGTILARSIVCESAFAEPRRMTDRAAAARAVARALGWDARRERALLDRFENPDLQAFCWIERRLDPERARRLRAAVGPEPGARSKRPRVPGVGFRNEYRRDYPQGSLAAHLIGLVELDGEGELTGRSGVESAFERELAGIKGLRQVLRDGSGRSAIDDAEGGFEIPPEHGLTIVLTIDAHVQRIVEAALARACEQWKPADGASAVVLDPKTGRVLALASWPTYDPGRLERTLRPDALRNRAIEDRFEPGSILKPIVAALALELRVVTLTEVFDCPQNKVFGGRRIVRDVHPLGTVPFSEVLVKSSNVGMAQACGERLQAPALHELLLACGFAAPPGIGLPNEAAGVVRPLRDFSFQDRISVAMGYAVDMTQLHMASAFAALAGDGRRLRPALVERVESHEGSPVRVFEPDAGSRLMKPETAAALRPILAQVVERGTGKRAAMPGYAVAGKTGTAKKTQTVVRAGGRRTSEYVQGRYASSFVAFAPAEDPAAVCIVTLHAPKWEGQEPFGGTVAAPVVKEILEPVLPYLGAAPRAR